MNNGKLAIVMPTYRFDMTARHCIETVASMAGHDIDVFIGDNSCNAEKWAFLRCLAERSPHCHIYCHETNLGPGGNWVFLMQQQQHEFMCLVSDDDVFSPDYFLAGFEELKSNPHCAAASGFFLVMAWYGDQVRFELAAPYIEPTSVERIWSYANYPGFNATNYAVHRRAAVVGFEAYMRDRPFYPAYMDQFQTYTLLAQGTRVVDQQRQMFVYNNNNWTSRETIEASNAGYFIAAGLPEQFKHLHIMCWAIDVVHYFNSIYCPPGLSGVDAGNIVKVLHDRLMKQLFSPYLLANLQAVASLFSTAPQALRTLQAIVETPCDEPARLLDLFVIILGCFDAALAGRYDRFVKTSLRPIIPMNQTAIDGR